MRGWRYDLGNKTDIPRLSVWVRFTQSQLSPASLKNGEEEQKPRREGPPQPLSHHSVCFWPKLSLYPSIHLFVYSCPSFLNPLPLPVSPGAVSASRTTQRHRKNNHNHRQLTSPLQYTPNAWRSLLKQFTVRELPGSYQKDTSERSWCAHLKRRVQGEAHGPNENVWIPPHIWSQEFSCVFLLLYSETWEWRWPMAQEGLNL